MKQFATIQKLDTGILYFLELARLLGVSLPENITLEENKPPILV